MKLSKKYIVNLRLSYIISLSNLEAQVNKTIKDLN